jgi:PAS domain S-box-containing protein
LIAVNKAWDDFAKDNGPTTLEHTSTGSNYFAVCEKAIADGDEIAARALEGILSVLNKERQTFELEYPCHSPTQQRWFILQVNNFGIDEQKVVISHQDISARKIAEAAQKQLEMRYRQIVETAQEGIWLIDENNKTTFVNDKMAKILEYSREEMIGKPNTYFMNDAGKEIAVSALGNRRNGIKEVVVMPYVTKSGRNIWTSISANPIFDDKGIYAGALGMVSDITMKILTEQHLENVNQLAGIGHWEVDLIKNSILWSPITRNIHEVDNDFIPDLQTAINFYKSGSDREAIAEALEKAIENGTPWDLELQIITANGNERWIRSIGEAEFVNGKCIMLYGKFMDIDKRKRNELDIVKIYKERNTILESIGDAFYAINKEWIITYWNKQAEKILGLSRDEVIGKDIRVIFADAMDGQAYIYYTKVMQENTVQHFEDLYEPMNVWFDISVYPSSDGLSIYFRDISERKFAEKKLKALNKTLKKNSRELAISYKGLEQFSYIISHNLRAPLANIIGIAEAMQDENYTPEELREFVALFSNSAFKLDTVIKDLNHILHTRNNLIDSKKPVCFSELVEDIKISILSVIADESVIIQTDFSQVNELLTTKSYLYSIFHNLITNSIKYKQPDVHPIICIQSKRLNDNIILSFKDNGIGIDLSNKGDEVFGLYKRFHHHIEGKGMGLFMVKTQVEIIGGTIEIISEVNKGTEFIITLPEPINDETHLTS